MNHATTLLERINKSSESLRQHLNGRPLPKLAIILGSGFKQVLDDLSFSLELNLKDLSGFPVPKVAGHGQSLLFSKVGDRECVIVSGRVHMYEGFSAHDVVHTLRVLANCGVTGVLLTNAAGGLHTKLRPGDVMAIRDQINLSGHNCLTDEARELGKQFVDMTQGFDAEWLQVLRNLCHNKTGVYIGTLGPTYETPAETRMFATLGGDVIGMSTVQEVIAARQLNLRVGCLSFVTNLCGGLGVNIDHQHVLDISAKHSQELKRILKTAISTLPL